MISIEVKNTIISEIQTLIGAKNPPPLLNESHWLELDSGIWLVNKTQQKVIESLSNQGLLKKIKYAGIFIGKVRRNFGLSIESLNFLQPYIMRYIIIRGKTLQKFLYGKTITITMDKSSIDNLELQKIIVMTPEKQPVGIAGFTILEEQYDQKINNISLKLDPITDLGMFLRKERTMFE